MKNLWGGRFAGALEPELESFNRSFATDRRLWREDLRVNRAWAAALARAGVLDERERAALVAGLSAIEAELGRDPSALDASDAEDIHTFLDARLSEVCADAGRKLSTGRSRNDQVATDLKLFAKSAARDLQDAARACIEALVEQAERTASLPIPGYTHMQRAQPVTVGHHLLAYVEMLARDVSRLRDAEKRLDTCPLGSGALAGTAFPIDRLVLATDLGFAAPTANSLDAVSDRDHACELAFVCSLIQVHLSRLAEDWIFFSSQEARFLELSDAVTTGSSLMPQKKNPDGLELVRGKTGRVIGDLSALLVMLKGLPLAYDKDLQEDKQALFDCVDTARASLAITALVVRHAHWNAERCRSAAGQGYMNATDLADLLVAKGVPFRAAHERAGQAVRAAIELEVELEDLPRAMHAELFPELARSADFDLARELSCAAVLARRSSAGGTAPARVAAEVTTWKARLAAWPTRS